MRSYGLGIAFCMLLAALFAYQNPGDLVIRFLVWERVLPQGVWEIALFVAGVIAMWIISLSAILETRNKNAHQLKDQKERIDTLEKELAVTRDERNSLMMALKRAGGELPTEMERSDKNKWAQDICEFCSPDTRNVEATRSQQIAPEEEMPEEDAEVYSELGDHGLTGKPDETDETEVENNDILKESSN
ncbi:MAG: LapA family protein [Synergistales bacterium]|nr:LapA family protein [Synergistales bacterium]